MNGFLHSGTRTCTSGGTITVRNKAFRDTDDGMVIISTETYGLIKPARASLGWNVKPLLRKRIDIALNCKGGRKKFKGSKKYKKR